MINVNIESFNSLLLWISHTHVYNFFVDKNNTNANFLFLYILFLMHGTVSPMAFTTCDKNNLNIKYLNV